MRHNLDRKTFENITVWVRRSIRGSVFLLLLLTPLSIVYAQEIANTEFSVDSRRRGTTRVDGVTHALQFSITLGEYPGRGSKLPIVLNYSSKVWGFNGPSRYDRTPHIPDEGPFTYVYWQNYAQDTAAGWVSTLDWPRFRAYMGNERYNVDGKLVGGNPYTAQQLRMTTRMYIRLPNGAKHEFRRDDNVYDVLTSYCTTTDSCARPLIIYSPVSMAGTFYSVDGTRMRYDTATNTLWLPDGSRYVFVGSASNPVSVTHHDVNGNTLDYNYGSDQWTDTMGRVLETPLPDPNQVGTTYNATPRTDVYNLPGLGTGTQTYTLRWKHLRDPNTSETVLSDPNQTLLPFGDRENVANCNVVESLFESQACQVGSSGNDSKIVKSDLFNPVVLAEIEIPGGTKYVFRYNVYGEIDKIVYPTGAYERFEHGEAPLINPHSDDTETGPSIYPQANRGVKKHWISPSGSGTDEILTQYSGFTVTNPDGTRIERNINSGRDLSDTPYGFDSSAAGKVLQERFYSSENQMMRRTLNSYKAEGPRNGGHANATRDSRLEKTISIIMEPDSNDALMTMSVNEFDSHSDLEYFAYLNVKRVKQYGYVVVSKSDAQNLTNNFATFEAYFNSQTPVRVTETDYLYDSNYKARNITNLPTETRIVNPFDYYDVQAKTQITYDGMNLLDESESTRWVNPNTNYRGLVTSTKSWYDIAANLFVETKAQYDLMGNLRHAWDARDSVSQTAYSSTYDYAYPTSVTTPVPNSSGVHGSNTSFTTSTVYDFNTGLPTSATDANSQTTNFEYNDALLRPTKVTAPNGHQTITQYGAGTSASTLWVKTKSQIDASSWKEALTWYDGIGRTARTQSVDPQSGDVFVLTCYDNMNRVSKAANPFRGYTDQTCSTATGMEWTTNTFDPAGRPWKVTTPDNAIVETTYGLATNGGQIGTTVTVEDQADKLRRSITNALGQLTRVDEPNSSNQLGTIASPNQATYYSYNTLGKMVRVNQGVQNRYFMYDSLDRLLRVRQPEQEVNTALDTTGNPDNNSWTAGFSYDNNGNVLTATDAKNVTITNAYDALNRVTQRSYNDNPQTSTVNFYHDGAGLPSVPDFAKGKLTKVSSSVSESKYIEFDVTGRLKQFQQVTDGQTYTSKYTYNLSGALTEEEYPSGRKVKNEFDQNGELQRIFGNASPTTIERTYANSFTYFADGRIEKLKLGNGLWEAAKLNIRLQVTEFTLGHGPTSGDLWKLNIEYGELQTNGTVDATKNNGNIGKQTLSFSDLANPFVQSFKYDALYRLTEAKEANNGNQTWRQVFGYDRYGNRTSHEKWLGTTQQILTTEEHPDIDPDTNRFESTEGFTFDANGNIVVDAQGRQFTFNGDNKQTQVKDAQNNTVGTYHYDGEGKRIKKVVGAETTIFVYSSGKLIAEYSTATPPPNRTTRYTVTDQLGSPRVIVDALGQVVSRRDFLPFGEEIAVDGTCRKVDHKYGQTDHVRQKFTGYLKDEETGLDFAEARMYQNLHGRFTAVDPLLASGKSANPQTFNRYVYVLNNPLILVDPTGLQTATRIWFNPISPDGIQPPRFEETAPEGYEPVKKDGFGRFTYNAPGLEKNEVIELNPKGPSTWPSTYQFIADNIGGPFLAPSWNRDGYRISFSEEYLNSTPEPVAGVRDASLDFYGIAFGVIGVAKAGLGALVSSVRGNPFSTVVPRSSLEFTNRVTAAGLRENADSIFTEGIKEPIKFTSINGKNYILDGNHRVALSYMFKRDMVPAQQVNLPFGAFKTSDDVLNSAVPKSEVLNQSAVRYFDLSKFRKGQ